jgi:methionyl aminopeptidase
VSRKALELTRVTEEALWQGIAAAALGGHVGDISHAVERHVASRGDFRVVPDYTGHGIGSAMHQPPNVPNHGKPGKGTRLVEGLALAVEPMVVTGEPWTHTDDDEWTVRTDDGSLAAHFEHTFTLTEHGAWVLTAPDGGEAQLAALGARFGGH